jgi:hypothetical protein
MPLVVLSIWTGLLQVVVSSGASQKNSLITAEMGSNAAQ